MKRQLITNKILFCYILLFTQSVFAQTVENWYVNMPDELNPTLSKQNRLELLEYYKARQGDSVTNRYENQAHVLVFDSINRCLKVKNTPSTTFEMKIFNNEDSIPFLGIINTVCAPICHSVVQFYDTAWNRIPIQFTMPKAMEWLNKDSLENNNVDKEWVEHQLENTYITLTFDEVNMSIMAKNNTLEFMSETDRKLISPFINDKEFIYKLKDKIWMRQH
ncbi:MAG: DUF3256 family protein [Paludibacter sp.]|nr:DUF3256 family protein [Paludibacter sp.]